MTDGKPRVAVIGGGISGLAAAHQLVRGEMSPDVDMSPEVTVLESGDVLGGVLQTEEVDGFLLELGPDSLISRLPWGINLLRDIGMSDELINTNRQQQGVHVVHRGRLQRIPDGLAVMAPQRIWPMVTTPILSWRGKLRLAAERFVPARRSDADETLADFSRRRLGKETFERLVQPLAGGIYMGDPEQLSIQSTFPQFVEMESKYGSLSKATQAAKHKSEPTGGGPQYSLFVSPRNGFRSAIEQLSSELQGCDLRCNHQVCGVTRDQDRWLVEVKDTRSGESRQEEFAGLIVATPAYQAAAILSDVPARRKKPNQNNLSKLLAAIPYAGCVVVNLGFERDAFPKPLDSFGFLVPHIAKRPLLACTFSSVKYAHRAPENKVLLRAFLGGACFPEVLDWTDERIQEAVEDELRALLGVSTPPLFSRIKRWHRAMPQMVLGHSQCVSEIEQAVEQLPCLELAGNAYRGVGIPHCIRSGQQAAARLVSALQDHQEPSQRS